MQWLAHFDLDNEVAYRQWREQKLQDYPQRIDDLIVEIKDPRKLTVAEYQAMMQRIQKTNMVVYASNTLDDPDKDIARALGRQFGLNKLDNNTGADDQGITSLEVKSDQWHKVYIPYTDRQIHWHSDGYYNELSEQIYGLLLHCVRPADSGGENALMDQEVAYILLRDQAPELVAALMQPQAMTVPENRQDEKVDRPDRPGPVFMPGVNGGLHMRYTARQRSIIWADDDLVQRAVKALKNILLSDSPYIFRATLQSGQGLVSNNVLHDRSAFSDNKQSSRLLYRLRYFDRVSGEV